jgi:hypothetical protein
VVVTTVGTINPARAVERGIRGVRIVMQKNDGDLEELARLVDEASSSRAGPACSRSTRRPRART